MVNSVGRMRRLGQSIRDTVAAHLFNAAPPRLHLAGAEERVGDKRVVRLRNHPGKQPLRRSVQRQLAGVEDNELVIVYTDLDRIAPAVVLMRDGVQNRLAQHLARHRVVIHALQALVVDEPLEIFCVNRVHHAVGNGDQRAADFVPIEDVGQVPRIYFSPEFNKSSMR